MNLQKLQGLFRGVRYRDSLYSEASQVENEGIVFAMSNVNIKRAVDNIHANREHYLFLDGDHGFEFGAARVNAFFRLRASRAAVFSDLTAGDTGALPAVTYKKR